jgi:hypothetical protein
MWSSLKLVMTSKTDITSVPHSVILPLADEREVFSFQVQDLARFTLELSLYPTFGSKVIGRAIVLPSMFTDIQNHQGLVVPLLDHHLKTIGEVAFEVSCIKPFQGAQLEIGGRVETYWKSKVTPSAPSQDHAHQFQSHRALCLYLFSCASTTYGRPSFDSRSRVCTRHCFFAFRRICPYYRSINEGPSPSPLPRMDITSPWLRYRCPRRLVFSIRFSSNIAQPQYLRYTQSPISSRMVCPLTKIHGFTRGCFGITPRRDWCQYPAEICP